MKRYGMIRMFLVLSLLVPVWVAAQQPCLTQNPAAKPKIDFNGDGLADVLLRNLYTGEISAWLMNNAGAPQVVSYGTVPPSTGWTLIGAGDVNGDGCTDLLWVNSGSDPQTRGVLVA